MDRDITLKDWIHAQLVCFGDSWEDICHNIPEERLLLDMDCTSGLTMDNYLLWSEDRVYYIDENEYRIFGYELKGFPRNPPEATK